MSREKARHYHPVCTMGFLSTFYLPSFYVSQLLFLTVNERPPKPVHSCKTIRPLLGILWSLGSTGTKVADNLGRI